MMIGLRRYFLKLLIAISVLVIGLDNYSVEAKTVRLTKSAKSGKSTRIDTYMGWNNDCSFLTINIDIVNKPHSGSASPRVINSRIGAAQAGSAGKCKGRKIKGLGLYYKSGRGFHGVDTFKVKMKVRGQSPVFFIYKINVR